MAPVGAVSRGTLRLVACGMLITACVAHWVRTGDQTPHVPAHLLAFGVAFAAYLIALPPARGLAGRPLAVALAVAALWRVALVAAPPLLSDDVYRSVWEGRIQAQGGNPYAWADRPQSQKWAALRDPVWERVNHKDYSAIYPPLWQLAARAVVGLHDSVVGIKAFLVGCELATLCLLALALRRRGLPAGRLLVLAWSPLALVEVAGSGHNDAFGALWLAAALAALDAGRPLLSAVAAALGLQAKLLPGLVAAAWARRYRPLHALAALSVATLLLLPYASAGRGLARTLEGYARFWRFNETLFAALARATGSAAHAQVLALLLLLALVALLAARRVEPVAAALAVVSAWLLLSANVLPWYALWLLPLLVLRDAAPALLFTGTVQLAYLVYPAFLAGGPWHLGWDVRVLEYGPPLALALRALRRRREAA